MRLTQQDEPAGEFARVLRDALMRGVHERGFIRIYFLGRKKDGDADGTNHLVHPLQIMEFCDRRGLKLPDGIEDPFKVRPVGVVGFQVGHK